MLLVLLLVEKSILISLRFILKCIYLQNFDGEMSYFQGRILHSLAFQLH